MDIYCVFVCAVINACWVAVLMIVLTYQYSNNPITQGPDLILFDSNTASVSFTLEEPYPDTATAVIFSASKNL